MTRSQLVEYATALAVLLYVVGSFIHPEWASSGEPTVVILLVGLALSFHLRVEADRERAKRGAWLIPAAASGVALQWVFAAAPAERVRTALLGVFLVLAATALAWKRRTSAP